MKYKKKILFFCPSIEEGGVEKNLISLTNSLAGEFNISIVTSNYNKKKFFNKKINFISFKNNFFNKRSRLIKSLVCIVLFITNIDKKNIVISFQANVIGIILSKIFNNKVIVRSNASPNFYARNTLKRLFFSYFFKKANKIVVNSNDFSKEFNKFFNVKPTVIYNSLESINTLKIRANKPFKSNFFSKKKNTINLLSVGRLVKQKDHITILKALNLIKNKIRFRLCIVGKGYEKSKLLNFIHKNQLEKFVKLVGYKKNVYPYYKYSDVFILSSLYEGLPNTLIEALTFKLSIISSDCKTGPKEILKNYKNSKLFKIKDYNALAKLILKSKKRRNLKFFNDKRFDIKKNIYKYKKLINSIK